ncbi:DUF4430 domain-containing protein [Pseudogracilibacillus sp. SO10305]|uniref:DUF4430 domain-containing protein n=1 Tax=Pseudogracilibacillus sp. SO10305 TaxID=3098292 RepID=UPI00300E26BB
MKINKTVWKRISIVSLLLLFIFTIIYSWKDQPVALPENPIGEAIDSSKVPLEGEYKELLDELENEQEDNESEEDKDDNEKEEKEQEDGPEEKDEEKEEGNKDELTEDLNDQIERKSGETSEESNEKSKDSNAYKDADGNRVDKESPNISLDSETNDNSEENEYFTTTIKDGETVTESNYEFRVIHKENDYKVKKTEVLLNGKVVEKFNGKVTLDEDENIIGVKVTYEDKNKNTFTVTKTYTVYFVSDEIIIITNLDDGKVVQNENFSFNAEALLGDETIPLYITHNGNELDVAEDNQYNVVLQEGENEFVLLAEARGKKAKSTYSIVFEKKEEEIIIETDVENETVADPTYSFYAVAKADENQIDLKATLNGDTIHDDGGGNYSVTLNEGENKIYFEASHNGNTAKASYTVIYTKPDGGKEDEDVEQTIKLRINDLADGQTLKNSVHTFNVEAINDDGSRLTGQDVSISASNNGESISPNWVNDAHVSFTMNVQDGANNITVTAKDQNGNIGTMNMTVQGEIAGEGEPIGHVTLSLEATTIGLGYLIPPTQVELYANERGSETIDRVFEEYGITYEYTGTHENGFYLSHLSMPGLYDTKPKVPEDLAELVRDIADRFDEEDHSSDSLGEFDFTNGSGWMYSVNSTYPNVGFADYYFKEGDVIRIRYTLALGADIGGGMPGMDFGKEW